MATIEIVSEVFGTVWKIEKAEGDEVATGDVIMILESMKMEIPIEATTAGRIVRITVACEDSVEEDQVLCLMER